MRLFYASFLSPENMATYRSLLADVAAEVPDVLRPVPEKSHHLTLAFLGQIAEENRDRCLEVLNLARQVEACGISMAPPRILRSRGTPRLVVTDLVDGRERVSELQDLLRREFLHRFPASDVRAQPPHVTLARFKKRANRESAQRVEASLSRVANPSQPRTDLIASVHLVRSTLTPSGPVYESLDRSALRRRA